MNKKILILLPALALLLGGCQKGNTSSSGASQPTSSSSEEVAVEGVNISQTSATLDPGEKLQLSAVATPSTLSEKGVNWSTDAEGVATVSSGGLVTAVNEGTAHIKATAKADSTKSATCTITVNKAQVIVFAESIDLEKTYKIGLYQTQLEKNLFFNGEVIDSNGLRFNSSSSWADAVDVKVEQKSAGVYNLAATIGEAKKYLCTVSATDYHAALNDTATTDWAWDETYHTFTTMVNGTKYFVGTNGTYETLSFSDYSKYVASNDVIRLVYKVDKVNPTSVSIVEDAANVYAGDSVQLHAKAAPEGAQDAKITWSVTGNDKVSVDQNGLVTATEDAVVGSQATVKATWGELAGDTCVVTVLEKLNYGTLTNPLTIAEAKALIDKVPAGKLTAEKMFVKGYVSASHGKVSSSYRNDVWLTNDDGTEEKAFELYSVYADESLGEIAADSLIGKQVTAEGWGTNFGGTYEFSNKDAAGAYDNGYIHKVEDGSRTATSVVLSETEKFEINQGDSKEVTAKALPYGAVAEFEWAVAPADQGVEYKDGKVVASETATAGDYTLTANIKGHTTINASVTFTVKAGGDSGAALADSGIDFSSCKSSDKAFPSTTWSYITNNPSYPNPSFYAGGLKLNYVTQGLKSQKLVASSKITVTINVGALNAKGSSTGEPTDPTFTVYGLSAAETVLDTQNSGVVKTAGNVVITLNGTDIRYVKIIFTAFAYDGEKECNVKLAKVTLA